VRQFKNYKLEATNNACKCQVKGHIKCLNAKPRKSVI